MLKPLFTQLELIKPALERGDTILTPNRRLARSVIASVDAAWVAKAPQRVQAWHSPTIVPVQQYWVDEWRHATLIGAEAPRRLLSRDEQRYLWQQVIEADTSPEFSLLSSSAAAAMCQQAAESLALWMQDLSEQNLRSRFSFDQDCQAFLRWHDAVQSRYEQLDVLTTESAIASLLSAPNDSYRPRHLALLGVDDIPPLFKTLCDSAESLYSIDITPDGYEEPRLTVYSYPDSRSELVAAAKWCHEQVSSNPENRYAVVLADMTDDRDRLEQLLRREFDCLTGNYESLPVNFATGFSLHRVPLIRDALRILRTTRQEVRVEEVIAVLQSRFVACGGVDRHALAKGVSALRDLARDEVPSRIARILLEPSWSNGDTSPWSMLHRLEGGRPLHRLKLLPSHWVTVFAQILEAWGWPGTTSLDSLEFQQLQRWQDALDDFANKDALSGELNLDEVLTFFSRGLLEQQFQPQTADQSIQILGPKELVGLRFDGIWLTHMNAGTMPEPPRPNPYLPNTLQRELGMPGADASERRAQAELRWRHWALTTGAMYCSYQREVDGTEALASPFIANAQCSAEPAFTVDSRWEVQSQGTDLEPIESERIPLLNSEQAFAGVGSQVLEAQANCAFKAFASARLRVGPTAPTASGLLPSERGTILHRALYLLYNERAGMGAEGYACWTENDLTVIAAQAVKAITANRRELVGVAAIELESLRLVQLLQDWQKVDARHFEHFSVVECEAECEGDIGGLKFRLRIDRVDQDEDGNEVLIDYKSAAIESSNHWFQSPPTRPQLPLYASLRPTAKGVAIASLKPGDMMIKGVGEHPNIDRTRTTSQWLDQIAPEHSFESLRDHWKRDLESLADDFLNGVSDVDPTLDACRYCQRFELCRYSELAQ